VARPIREPVWPIVIGVAGLVMGIGGLLSCMFGVAVALAGEWITPSSASHSGLSANMFGEPGWLMAVYYTVTVLVSSMLTFGSLRLVKRNPVSRTWLMRWAVVKIPHAALAVYFTVKVQNASMQGQMAIWNTPGRQAPPPGAMAAIGTGMAWATGILLAVWCLWGPIVVLTWFSQSKIRAEVSRWRHPLPTPAPAPA